MKCFGRNTDNLILRRKRMGEALFRDPPSPVAHRSSLRGVVGGGALSLILLKERPLSVISLVTHLTHDYGNSSQDGVCNPVHDV